MSSGGYEAAVAGARDGARIAAVAPGSPAGRAGAAAGDLVLAVDGTAVRDVIDWRWLTSEPSFVVSLRSPDGAVREAAVRRGWDEQVGVDFDGLVFDGLRECDNACAFCFVAQMPEGMRPALNVRDDDYRLSFLTGTFVTLTNLTDADIDRILAQHLSPLYVSVHAVDPDVRRALVCPAAGDAALERLDLLTENGIEVHAQIVLVPGVNDGPVLERSLEWLSARPNVLSAGVVPVGFTRFQSRFRASYAAPDSAAAVLATIEPWRRRILAERGVRWVHAADELHLAASGAGSPEEGQLGRIPAAEAYDGFPQYENGIGMVRAFADAYLAALEAAPTDPRATPIEWTLLTGTLFAPVLRALAPLGPRHPVAFRVLPVANAFFGGNVTVTGLLTGRDIMDTIAADGGSGPYLLPDVVLSDSGVTLDDVRGEDIAALTGRDVRVVSCDAAGLVRTMLAASED